ncbi:MAG TPA: hypothetical protein VFJ06_14360 [Halococcus sp.]|nr:hypothetical protein [Halococcus sp.]
MKTIKVSNPVHEQLTELRDTNEHTSIDSVLRELLHGTAGDDPITDTLIK